MDNCVAGIMNCAIGEDVDGRWDGDAAAKTGAAEMAVQQLLSRGSFYRETAVIKRRERNWNVTLAENFLATSVFYGHLSGINCK